MKDGFRQCMAWLHTWTGLIVGWVLFFVFVTGTVGYFHEEVSRWMKPELPLQQSKQVVDKAPLIDHALNRLEQVAPDAASWSINLPHYSVAARNWQGFSIRWEEMPKPEHKWGARGSEQLDSVTGGVAAPDPEARATGGGFRLYRMHYALHYLPYEVAIYIVGVCTMLMLIAIVTGVITHKKIFKDFFTFRGGKGQRSWLDAHNLVSVMALPFFLMITYSGLVFFLFNYMPAGLGAMYGISESQREVFFDEFYGGDHEHLAIGRPAVALAPLVTHAEAQWGVDQVRSVSIEHEAGEAPTIVVTRVGGNRVDYRADEFRYHAQTGEPLPPEDPDSATRQTQSVMLALHEGKFADIWTRWLYFAASLLGCVMIGTGLVLWTVKRRKQHLGAPNTPVWEGFGLKLVETLNVATLAGLPLGIAAYLWANRLLPVDLTDRAAWEVHSMFSVWLCTLFYALLRPLARSWIELLWATCAAYALLPVLNVLTTDRHLGVTLVHGDWVLAGVDLTLWGLAAIFGYMAVKVTRRLAPAVQPAKESDAPVAIGRAKRGQV